MFLGNYKITDISPIANWNTSNFTMISGMFSHDWSPGYDNSTMSITSLEPLKNWNVSNVEEMSDVFRECNKIGNTAQYLNGWNTSKVSNMNSAFYGCPSKPSWYTGG